MSFLRRIPAPRRGRHNGEPALGEQRKTSVFYDKSWMAYGMLGGLEAGLIVAVVGFVLFGVLRWLVRKAEHANYAGLICLSLGLALVLGGGEDMWDLFYFNYAPLNSIPLLQAKLATVHDPDALGTRVFFEMLGATVGVFLSWALFTKRWRTQ